MKRYIVIAIIVILAGGGGYAYMRKKKNAQPSYLTERVQTIHLIQTVSASGNVKSANEVMLAFEQNGRVDGITAHEGELVEPGQTLITLNQTLVASKFADAQAALSAAQAEYDKLIAGATAEERSLAEINAENARNALTHIRAQARADVAQYEQAVREADEALAAARTALDQDIIVKLASARSAADTAEKKGRSALNTLEEIYDKDDTFRDIFSIQNIQTSTDASYAQSQTRTAWTSYSSHMQAFRADPTETGVTSHFPSLARELEQIRDTLNATSVALNDATVSSSASKTVTTYRSDVLSGWSDLNTAITELNSTFAALQSARNNGDANVRVKLSAFSSAENTLLSITATTEKTSSAAEAELKKAEAELNKVIAPPTRELRSLSLAKIEQARSSLASAQAAVDQTTLKSPIAGIITKIHIKKGETVNPGQTAVRMLAANNLEVTVQAPEADIPKVSVGDKADITLDAYSDERAFTGTVSFINPAETLVEGVVYYDVTIIFESPEEGVKPGMSADVTIHTDDRPQALAVPLRAVKENNGTSTIEVLLTDGTVDERPVTTGLRGNGGLVEILEGLHEGEEVVVGVKKK